MRKITWKQNWNQHKKFSVEKKAKYAVIWLFINLYISIFFYSYQQKDLYWIIHIIFLS